MKTDKILCTLCLLALGFVPALKLRRAPNFGPDEEELRHLSRDPDEAELEERVYVPSSFSAAAAAAAENNDHVRFEEVRIQMPLEDGNSDGGNIHDEIHHGIDTENQNPPSLPPILDDEVAIGMIQEHIAGAVPFGHLTLTPNGVNFAELPVTSQAVQGTGRKRVSSKAEYHGRGLFSCSFKVTEISSEADKIAFQEAKEKHERKMKSYAGVSERERQLERIRKIQFNVIHSYGRESFGIRNKDLTEKLHPHPTPPPPPPPVLPGQRMCLLDVQKMSARINEERILASGGSIDRLSRTEIAHLQANVAVFRVVIFVKLLLRMATNNEWWKRYRIGGDPIRKALNILMEVNDLRRHYMEELLQSRNENNIDETNNDNETYDHSSGTVWRGKFRDPQQSGQQLNERQIWAKFKEHLLRTVVPIQDLRRQLRYTFQKRWHRRHMVYKGPDFKLKGAFKMGVVLRRRVPDEIVTMILHFAGYQPLLENTFFHINSAIKTVSSHVGWRPDIALSHCIVLRCDDPQYHGHGRFLWHNCINQYFSCIGGCSMLLFFVGILIVTSIRNAPDEPAP